MSKDDLQDQLEGLFSGSVPKPDEPSPAPEAPASETPASEPPVPGPEPVADVPLPERVSAFEQSIVLGGAPDTEGAPSPPKGAALPEPASLPGVTPAPAAEPPEPGSAQAPFEAAPPSAPLSATPLSATPLSATPPPPTSRGSMLSLGRQPDEALPRPVEQPLDVSLQAEGLEQGRIHILNLLLGGAMIGGGLAVLALLVGVLQKPSRLVSDLPFFFAYLLIVTMFFARKLPSLLRMSVLFGVAYLVAFFSALL
ncbi:MAG: hypothetical protein JXA89_09425, partial [Anaerolineae bacterium]|nr:hypothetical protein [Anaerolineae bacterium]